MNENVIINIMVIFYFAKMTCNNNFHEEDDDDNVDSARALGRATYATNEWASTQMTNTRNYRWIRTLQVQHCNVHCW